MCFVFVRMEPQVMNADSKFGSTSVADDVGHERPPALNSSRGSMSPVCVPATADWSSRDDVELMNAVQRRCQGALEVLYDRYAGRVMNLCRRITGRDDLAEDAMLDTFWEAWNRPERFDADRASPATYLLMLARCRAIDVVRTEKAHHARAHHALAADPSHPNGLCCNSDIRDDGAGASDLDADLEAVLRDITPKCRDAIQLCVLNGLSAQQAAQSLDVPLGTLKSRVRKGIIQMRNLLRTHREGAVSS
jgi:RNA polymerase sigma-70 factor (ECF subfamily)